MRPSPRCSALLLLPFAATLGCWPKGSGDSRPPADSGPEGDADVDSDADSDADNAGQTATEEVGYGGDHDGFWSYEAQTTGLPDLSWESGNRVLSLE